MTDTDALKERIAEALDPYSEIIAVHEGYGAEVVVHTHQSAVIAAVLPIVAEEVRKALRAEAHALMEDVDEGPVTEKDIALFQVRDRLIHRATEYETGDSDEHR